MKDEKSIKKLYKLLYRILEMQKSDISSRIVGGGSISRRIVDNKYFVDSTNIINIIELIKMGFSANKHLYEYANLLWKYYSPESRWRKMPLREEIEKKYSKVQFK